MRRPAKKRTVRNKPARKPAAGPKAVPANDATLAERIATAPVSPLGQRTYVRTKYATSVTLPSTLGVDPLRAHQPENEEQPVSPIYAWVVVTDREEGLVMVTVGTLLDPIADKGLLLSGVITLSISNWSDIDPGYGKFPVWFPVLVISRDAVILVGATVLHLLNGKVRLRPSWTGKVATVLQMCAIAWVMLQLHFIPLPYVVIAAGVFTFISGVIYVLNGIHQAQEHAHAKVD